jgi:hypothetical protein
MPAINHRSSVASRPDFISPLFLKHLPQDAYPLLLNILNRLWLNSLIPPSWKEFKVFPIPKPNGEGFHPISLSSAFCKVVETILRNRLDWWLELNHIFPSNMYGFIDFAFLLKRNLQIKKKIQMAT